MKQVEEEYERGKALLGDHWTDITELRLGLKNNVSRDEITQSDPIFTAAKKNLDSPEQGLAELRRLYTNRKNLTVFNLMMIALWAAYFGDPEFSMDAMEKSINLEVTGIFYV